jgi:hypothetical protein
MEILHKKGKDNIATYALARKDEESLSLAILVVAPEWLDEICSKYAKNLETCVIINNHVQDSKFEWRNDILWYKGIIYLISHSKFKSNILKESHDSPTVGHVGFFKTYYNAHQSFFWKGMSKDIHKYIAECDQFQRNKSENVMTPGLLHLLHIPNKKMGRNINELHL